MLALATHTHAYTPPRRAGPDGPPRAPRRPGPRAAGLDEPSRCPTPAPRPRLGKLGRAGVVALRTVATAAWTT